MRLNQILTEAEQQELEVLTEGPLGSLAKAAGRGVGNVIGGVARAAGTVKGAVKGAVARAKSSFAGGEKDAYDALSGKPETPTASKPAAGSTVGSQSGTGSGGGAAGQGGAAGAQGAAGAAGKDGQPGAQGAAGAAGKDGQPGAQGKPSAPAAQQPAAQGGDTTTAKPAAGAAAKSAAAPAANDSAYAQAQKAVNGLAPEQKKEVIAMLQADPKVKAAMSKPAASSADFDPEFGVPITPAGVATYAKHGAKANAKKADAAVAAGWTHDSQTGIWSPPNKAKAASSAPAKKPATAKMGTVKQKQLTPTGFGQMVGGLTKKAG